MKAKRHLLKGYLWCADSVGGSSSSFPCTGKSTESTVFVRVHSAHICPKIALVVSEICVICKVSGATRMRLFPACTTVWLLTHLSRPPSTVEVLSTLWGRWHEGRPLAPDKLVLCKTAGDYHYERSTKTYFSWCTWEIFAISWILWALHGWDIRRTCICNEFSTMPTMLLMEAAGCGGQGWCWQAGFTSTTLIAWICFGLRRCFCGIVSFINSTNYEYKYCKHQLDIGGDVSKITTIVTLTDFAL